MPPWPFTTSVMRMINEKWWPGVAGGGGGGRQWGARANFTRFTTTSWTSSRSIFQSFNQNCFTLILHIYLPKLRSQSVKKRIGQIRRKWRLLTAAHLTDTCSLISKERVQWVGMLVAVGKEHTPSAFSTLPLVEVLFLKSKITEVYANDPEASRKHLILLPRVSQKVRKAFALF